MKYSAPELVVLGSASALVQGVPLIDGDNINPDTEQPAEGFVVGLDD
jgi:hypothetical protein